MSVTSVPIISRSPRNRAAQGVRELILQGRVRAGERLPAEEALAEQFSVSRATLRSALQQLENDGLIKRQRNYGCVVTRQVPSDTGLMSQTIAMIGNVRMASHGRVYSGLSDSVHSGALLMATRHEMNLLAMHGAKVDASVIDRLVESRPRGVVVGFWTPEPKAEAQLRKLRDAQIPLVVYGDSPEVAEFDRVVSDHVGGAEALTRQLIDSGKRSILRVWTMPAETSFVNAHNIGHERAMTQAGLEICAPVYVEGLPDRGAGDRAAFDRRARYLAGYLVEQFKQRTVDAIMVTTDCEVYAVAAACRYCGVEGMTITGYDNQWADAFEREFEPIVPWATVEKHNHTIGEAMVELLLDRMNGKLPAEAQLRVIEQDVIRN
jgi:DNA-binding LacI/PurR family transcriptional regulator